MTTYIALREFFSSNDTGLQDVPSPSDNPDGSHTGDGECYLTELRLLPRRHVRRAHTPRKGFLMPLFLSLPYVFAS